MPDWLLSSLEIAGGFLDGVRLDLPPGLTCVIGPRGSGKSTLTEAIRYGISGIAGASKSRSELVQANLGTAVVTLRTINCADGSSGYTIRRSYRQAASLIGSNGGTIPSVDLDRGTFLPLDGFSSTEIEAIADESLGERRRALLDDLSVEAMRAIEMRVADLGRSLEANADRVKATRRLIGDITEQTEEIGDARGRLSGLPAPDSDDTAVQLRQAAKQRMINDQELNHLDQCRKHLTDYSRHLEDLVQKYASIKLFATSAPESANIVINGEVEQITASSLSDVKALIRHATDRLDQGQASLESCRMSLATAHESQEAQYQQLQEVNLAASHIVRERATIEESIVRLERLEEERGAEEANLIRLLDQRHQITKDFLLERERISELREHTAAELQRKAVANVRIRVLRHDDDLAYQQVLLDGLKGANLRNHDNIMACLQRLRPEQMAQIIQDSDEVEMETQTSLGTERCHKILEAFQSKIDPLALEVLATDDRICIELNVGTSVEPLFKDASDLSRGQKCTALLPLLLARRDIPLVIDQPEDNLDNHFIYQTVVETIRQMKTQRQMVFITHNANIPVLGEADYVVVMNSDGKRGYVEKAGSLDECRDEIVNLLEGGKDAFEQRRQRYLRA